VLGFGQLKQAIEF